MHHRHPFESARALARRALFFVGVLSCGAPAFAAEDNTADPDRKPDAPSPEVPNPAQDVKTYAGVGSNTAYSERGVMELGGSLALATANGTSSIAVEPSVGYFLFDNFELTGVVSVRHTSISGANANQLALIAEPSVHFPVNDGVFVFAGLGVGVAVYDTSVTSLDTGLDLAPRAGAQLLLGRSGMLNLALRYSAVLSSLDGNVNVGGGQTVLAFQNQLDLQGGYTIMF
jgi:hypothetical protein